MQSRRKKDVNAEVCKILNKIGALKFGAFKLSSGKVSPYYVDLRIVPSFPDFFQNICGFCVSFIKDCIGTDKFDRVAGIPVAGISFASVISYGLKKPFLYIRKGAGLRGRERRIEGIIAPGDRVLLIDDLITTGLSLLKATRAVRAESGVIGDAVVLLDRQEGGREKLAQNGVTVHTLLNITEVAKTLQELGAIEDEQFRTILKQVKKR